MLRPPLLQPPSFSGFGKHLCAGCERETEGIPIGGYCRECRVRRERRAARVSQRVALLTTLPLAAYITWVLSRAPQYRLYAIVGLLVWYLAVRRIARRLVLEWIT